MDYVAVVEAGVRVSRTLDKVRRSTEDMVLCRVESAATNTPVRSGPPKYQ